MKVFQPRTMTPGSRRGGGFTLIEIMIVVAIIGLVAAMGLPSIIKALQREGMRKAINDVTEVCKTARANAIIHNKTVAVVIHPADGTFAAESGVAEHSGMVSASTLPSDVQFAMVDVNGQDFLESEWTRVFFYPNGTNDEMTLVLHDRTDWRKITLEFATGFPNVTDVDR